jgi:hypothetical protein
MKKIKDQIVILLVLILCSFLFACKTSEPVCRSCQDQNPVLVKGNLGSIVNSTYDDFAPVLYQDTTVLFFTSNRCGGRLNYKLNDANKFGEDIYVSKNINGKYSEPKILTAPGVSELNEGTFSFFSDQKRVIISRCYDKEGLGGSELYEARLDNDLLSFHEFINLGTKVNSVYWEAQPAISSDGNIIIFASDRPGGFGGTDLWLTERKDNKWMEPVNLGPSINSDSNEYAPSLDEKSQILFFSSNRKGGLGGLDIYYSYYLGESQWEIPSNLGLQVNSKHNELFPVVVKNLKRMYYSSNKPGGCGGYDLYSASINIPIKPNPVTLGSPLMKPIQTTTITERKKEEPIEKKKEKPAKDTTKTIPVYEIFLSGLVKDSLADEPIGSQASITISDEEGKVIYQNVVNPPSSNFKNVKLEPGKQYKITASAYRYDTKSEIIQTYNKSENIEIEIPLYCPPIGLFDLKDYNVPFFVSGYYRLNVIENLTDLKNEFQDKFSKAGYIENPGSKYDRYSKVIEKIFDTVFIAIIDTLIPKFNNESQPNDYIEINVFGYTDPRSIRSGEYLEEDISYDDIEVKKGTRMNNEVLSKLRAYYTMQYINKELYFWSKGYRDLRDNDKIVFRIKGLGIDEKTAGDGREEKLDASRRAKISIYWRKK